MFPIFPNENAEYIVERKECADIGVRQAVFPVAPLEGVELVGVAVLGNSVFFWWRRKMSFWDRLIGKRWRKLEDKEESYE